MLNLLKKTEGKVAVPIVPVGLNYVQKNKFRSNVLIRYSINNYDITKYGS